MSQDTENYLSLALKKLELAYDQILKTTGYTQESEKIKILAEFIKEQKENEDSRSATR